MTDKKLQDELEQDLLVYGAAFTKVSFDKDTGLPRQERISPLRVFKKYNKKSEE